MHQNLRIFNRVSLLTSGFLTGLTLFLFYSTHRFLTFLPPAIPSGLLPQWVQWYQPEIDLSLYIGGVMITLVSCVVWYLTVNMWIKNKSDIHAQYGIALYLRFIIALVVFLFFFLVSNWDWWTHNYLLVALCVFFLITIMTAGLLFYQKANVQLISGLLLFLNTVFTLLLGFFIVWLLMGVFVFNNFRQGSIYTYLINNDYWAFSGFGPGMFLSCGGALLIATWIWLQPLKLSRQVRTILLPMLDLLVICGILWLTSTVSVIRVDDDIELARHNLSTFIGPIADVLAGKSILVDAPSQYGLLVNYALSTIFNFLPRMYTSLIWINYVFMSTGIILMYVSARQWFGWGAIGFIVLLFEHYYFSTSTNILWNSSQGFVRFGAWIPVFFFLVLKDRLTLPDKLKRCIELILVGVGVFWGLDTGLYGLLAYLVYRSYIILVDYPQQKWIIKLSTLLAEITITVVSGAVLISFFTFIRAGEWPDWTHYGLFASIYTAGFYVFPMKIVGPYLIVLSIYVATTIILLATVFEGKRMTKHSLRDYSIAAYVVALGIAQFIYFTGHSNTNGNLHTISIPALLLIMWLIFKIPVCYRNLNVIQKQVWSPMLFWTIMIGVAVWLTVITSIGTATVIRLVAHRLDVSLPLVDQSYRELYLTQSAGAINNYLTGLVGNKRRVAIVSTDIHYYIFKTKSANVLSYNNNWTLLTTNQVENLASEIARINPEVIFVDDLYHANNELIFSSVRNRYTIRERYGALNMWVRSDTIL